MGHNQWEMVTSQRRFWIHHTSKTQVLSLLRAQIHIFWEQLDVCSVWHMMYGKFSCCHKTAASWHDFQVLLLCFEVGVLPNLDCLSSGAIILYTSWCFCRDSGSLRSYFEFSHLIPDNYCEILAEFHECTETLVSDLFAQHTCLCLFVCLFVGWLAGWLAGWLVGWLVGWFVGWLVGFCCCGCGCGCGCCSGSRFQRFHGLILSKLFSP